jgi:hypothetical protein
MSTPIQYQANTPTKQDANLSPLQPAISYYMAQGQQTPFFVNHDFLRQLTVFADSGIVTPAKVNVPAGIAVIAEGDDIYVIRGAQDCGADINRYEKIYVGKRDDVAPQSWSFTGITVRGGSAAGGAGGPWGTGGLTSQDPTPNNSVNRQPDIISNLLAAYGSNVSTSTDSIA